MEAPQHTPARNQTMDLCKLLASFFVVFIHVPFPGQLGSTISCLARFAVPLFFMISGYFSYRTDSSRLRRRIVHIVVLNLAAIGVQILWNLFSILTYGGTLADFSRTLYVSWGDIAKWLVLNLNPFGGHLWYLGSIFTCYVVLWLYVRFFGDGEVSYQPLYLLGVCLLSLHFILGEFSAGLGLEIPYQLPRNALLLGLPIFTMGIFLRQYRERIMANFHLSAGKMMLLLLGGILLSIGEQQSCGTSELYVGTLIAVVMLFLLAAAHPTVPVPGKFLPKLLGRFGAYSTGVYLLHMAVNEYYMGFRQYGLYLKYGQAEEMLRPLIIVGASLLLAVGWDCLTLILKWAAGHLHRLSAVR